MTKLDIAQLIAVVLVVLGMSAAYGWHLLFWALVLPFFLLLLAS